MDGRGTPLLDALARAASAGAGATDAQRDAWLICLNRGSHLNYGMLAADPRVVPALAAAICSRHAADAVVEQAMGLAADLLAVAHCPAAARRAQQDSLVHLGALRAAVQRLSAGGRVGGAAAALGGALADERPEVAGAAVAAGALPRLVALLGDADGSTAHGAAAALAYVAGRAGRDGTPTAVAAVDAGAVRAAAELLGRPGLSAASLVVGLKLLGRLVPTPAGGERLVAEGALPHVVRLLRSPAWAVADHAVACLISATSSDSWGPVAEALLADATAGPALLPLLLRPDGDAPFCAACVLGATVDWALPDRSPEALRQAGGLAAAARRAGAVPRLVELLRALEGEQRRFSITAFHPLGVLATLCLANAAAAREALRAGAWPEACRVLITEQDACGNRADERLVALSVSLLASLVLGFRDGAPRPAAAAAEPGLCAALARALGRAVAPLRGDPAALDRNARLVAAGRAAAVLEEALRGSDGAQRAAEFIHAGGAGHLVRAGLRWVIGVLGKGDLGPGLEWAHRRGTPACSTLKETTLRAVNRTGPLLL
jgi:hypothetical protein